MTLTIDLGNTRAKLTLFSAKTTARTPENTAAQTDILEHHSVTHQHLVAQLQQMLEQHPNIQRICWCAVGAVPTALTQFLEKSPCHAQQLLPTAPPAGITIGYHTPETLGADRLAAVLGAQSLLPHHTVLVIDAGTCITFDLLRSDGHYLGGNISPGLDMRLKAMHHHTAKLPLVTAQGAQPSWGYDTLTALRSGAIWGIHHEIMGYIAQVRAEYPNCCAFLTGGNRYDFNISTQTCNFAAESDAIATDNRIFADEYLVARGLYALP